jgi:hypothetical protein
LLYGQDDLLSPITIYLTWNPAIRKDQDDYAKNQGIGQQQQAVE